MCFRSAFCCFWLVAWTAFSLQGGENELRWSDLDPFQGKLTRAEFETQLISRYAPNAEWSEWFEIFEDFVLIRTSRENAYVTYRLAFAETAERIPEGEGKVADENSAAIENSTGKSSALPSLRGMRIALDPGHLGGAWGPMEFRSFAIGDQPVVQEGDLVFATAKRLQALLEEEGAEVALVRNSSDPVTDKRPEDFLEEAFRDLARGIDQLPSPEAVRSRAESLFYRGSEIRARAERVNSELQPELVIALHIDATAWPEGDSQRLSSKNTGHILINGSYLSWEIADDQNRLEMVWRIVNAYGDLELTVSEAIAEKMEAATSLEPAVYTGNNALRVGTHPYVYARNLLANRTYRAPVVYMEPWTLNSEMVYPWASLGDYEGRREINGVDLPSLPALYAQFVFDGLVAALGGDTSAAH
jgi:N-acetylmuramoyl-L-alanine amidase